MSKIYFAADHAGFDLKNAVVEHAKTLGYDVQGLGALALDSEDDYPDFVTSCAKKVAVDSESRGILGGGSGEGEAMCANRVKGARAAVFYGRKPVTAALDIE